MNPELKPPVTTVLNNPTSVFKKAVTRILANYNNLDSDLERHTKAQLTVLANTVSTLREARRTDTDTHGHYIAVRQALANLDPNHQISSDKIDRYAFTLQLQPNENHAIVTLICYCLNDRYYVRYRTKGVTFHYQTENDESNGVSLQFIQDRNVLLEDLDTEDLRKVLFGEHQARVECQLKDPEQPIEQQLRDFLIGGQHELSYQLFCTQHKDVAKSRVVDGNRILVENSKARLTIRVLVNLDGVLYANATLSLKDVLATDPNQTKHRLIYTEPISSFKFNIYELFYSNIEYLATYYHTNELQLLSDKDSRLMIWWLRTLTSDLDSKTSVERRLVRSVLQQCAWELRRFYERHQTHYVPGYFYAIDHAFSEAGIPNSLPDFPFWVYQEDKDDYQRSELQRLTAQYFRYLVKNPSEITDQQISTLLELIKNY